MGIRSHELKKKDYQPLGLYESEELFCCNIFDLDSPQQMFW